MKNITSTTELKNAILLLEIEQRAKGLELKQEFANINPLSLIKETFRGEDKSTGIIENVIVGGVGLAAGFLTRKVFVGSSANIFRKLLGSALQFGATTVIAQNSQSIKSVGQFLFSLYPSKKKRK